MTVLKGPDILVRDLYIRYSKKEYNGLTNIYF